MTLLFLCVANSARSQVAEGLSKALFAKHHRVLSAGSMATFVHPLAIEVMREIDIDISRQSSKSVSAWKDEPVDLVITLCKEEVCPVFLKNCSHLHWPLPDPVRGTTADQILENFRSLRQDLNERINDLGLRYHLLT